MLTPITLNGATVQTVALPTCASPRSVEFAFSDAVAIVSSPFTGQTQAQQWPGADSITGTVTMPPLTQTQADAWISFLMQLRGMAYAFQIGDPMKPTPAGTGSGTPQVDMTTTGWNVVGSQTLHTKGWHASSFGLLLPGDYLQIGYRLHRCLDRVNSDSSGKASFQIWPSLRDLPTDGEAINLNNPVGLFRLDSNQRQWSSDYTRLTQLTFKIREYR